MVSKVEIITEKLNTIYSRVSQLQDLKQVLLSIYEYIDIFDSTPELIPVYESIKITAHEETKHIAELEAKALQETAVAYGGIKAYIQKGNITHPKVLDELQDYEGSVAGTYTSSLGKLKERHGSLCYTLMCLVEEDLAKHLKFCRRYGVIKDDGRIINWNFSPSYEKWEDATEKLKRQELTKVWYSWDKLVTFYSIYKDYEDLQSSYIKEGKTWNIMGLALLHDEIKSIIEGTEFTARANKEYKLDDYKIHLERLHTYTRTFLVSNESKKDYSLNWYYEANNLTINNISIVFRQGLRRELMIFLTKNEKSRKSKHLFADIHEKIGDIQRGVKLGIVALYEACKGINGVVASKTGIVDFLKYDTLEVQINPKYI